MNRYSPGHSVVKIGCYFTPLIPMWLMSGFYPSPPYVASLPDLVLLWLIGLALSYALIAIHECGHALVGRLVGIEIAGITVGHWRRLFAFTIGGIPVTIRAAPATGYVTFKQTPALVSAWRMSAALLAGVGAKAGFVVLVGVLTTSPHRLESLHDVILVFVRVTVLCLGGLQIVVSLLPSNGWIAGTEHPTDGLQLLNLWRNREQLPGQRRLLEEARKLDALFKARKFSEAILLAQSLLAHEAENIGLIQYHALLHAENGDTRIAEAIWRDLLTKPIGAPKLAEVLDQLCCLTLYYGRADLLAEADQWSNEALRYAPGAITLEGTRGSVLIELGRVEEGTAMLRRVLKRSECAVDQVIGCAYLAKAAATQGNRDEAQRWLKKARTVDAQHHVVRRIETELRPLLT